MHHLPTFQLILQNVEVYSKDRSRFQKEFQKIATLTVKDVMNKEPLTLFEEATFEETVMAFQDHHRINPIPILDKENKVVGMVSRYNILEPLYLLSARG